VGSNANSGLVQRCYTTGAVQAENGSFEGDFSGQPGASAAANAGGIAGYNYYTTPAYIKYCVALNSRITAIRAVSGLNVNAHRIAGLQDNYGSQCQSNIANVETMTAGGSPVTPVSDANGLDGADCTDPPAQTAYTALGWDFTAVWTMGANNYPELRWQ
jgi:hypothetical protein